MEKLHDSFKNESMEDIIISGLITDGGHHKQWFLAQCLFKLGYSEDKIYEMFMKRHDCKTKEEYIEEYFEIDFGIPD